MPVLHFKKILNQLQNNNVQYILVGGMAAIGYGMNYVTNDIDICYERSDKNIKSLVSALAAAKPKLRTSGGSIDFIFDEKTIKNGLNFTLDTPWGPLDLLGELQNLGGYKELIKNTVKMNFYGIKVPTIALDDLIKAKESAGRTKDKLHLLELKAIRQLTGKE